MRTGKQLASWSCQGPGWPPPHRKLWILENFESRIFNQYYLKYLRSKQVFWKHMKYSTAWTLLVCFISIHSNMPSSRHPAGLVQRRQVRYFLGCTYFENDPINLGWSVVWGQRARKPGNTGSTVVFAWENGFYVLYTCTLLHRNAQHARQDQRMDSLQE